jgi:hypothetical protein
VRSTAAGERARITSPAATRRLRGGVALDFAVGT